MYAAVSVRHTLLSRFNRAPCQGAFQCCRPRLRVSTWYAANRCAPLALQLTFVYRDRLVPCASSALALRIRRGDCCLARLPTLLCGRSARRLAVCDVVSLSGIGMYQKRGVARCAPCTRGVLRALLDCEPARGVESYFAPRRSDSPYTKKDSRARAAPLILRRSARVRVPRGKAERCLPFASPTSLTWHVLSRRCLLNALPPFMLSFGSERHGISPNGEKPRGL